MRLLSRHLAGCAIRSSSRFSRPSVWLLGVAVLATLAGLTDQAAFGRDGQELVLVADGKSLAPIIVSVAMPAEVEPMAGEYGETPSSFRAELRASADELATYIEKISGVRPEVIEGMPASVPAHAIWVGYQPVLESLFPEIDFEFKHPEEILIAANANHLVIAGRDRGPDEVEEVDGLFDHFRRRIVSAPNTEEGTANAVNIFLQRYLGVRWLWPGELGEDVIASSTIKFAPFEYRFHPPIRARMFNNNPRGKPMEIKQWWEQHHRSGRRASMWLPTNHSVEDWWEKYHEAHPDYFALRPDGVRAPASTPKTVKLCVSNPAVAEQWLVEAAELIRANPRLQALRMLPTDGGGWCVCDNCRAWDHPSAPAGVLTERYVKFWNILARGLRERFPEREIYLDQFAYSTYASPPIDTRLESNITIRYVGHFPLGDARDRAKSKAALKKWAEMGARTVGYRPNGLWYDGGFWGMPAVELKKTAEDFRFLGEIGADAFQFDSVQMYFATLGPQLYAMVELAYDPMQDGQQLMADYFARGFGPAADDVRRYFELMEHAHTELVETEGWRAASGARRAVVAMITNICTPEFLSRAQSHLDAAKARTADGSDVYQQRVHFVQTGLDFVKLQLEIAVLMEKVRRTGGKDRAAVEEAVRLSAARDELLQTAPPFAFDNAHFQYSVLKSLDMQDHLGPPSAKYLEVKAEASTQAKPLAVADHWRLSFSDDFQRSELGPEWKALAGKWSIQDGALVASGGDGSVLMATRRFPGLHRIEIEAAAIPRDFDPAHAEASLDRVGDLSVLIQAGADDSQSGYFLQFGGRYNKLNSVQRTGDAVVTRHQPRIVPGRFHVILAEFDGSHVRLKVDGQQVLEYKEEYPLVGAEHQAVGLYFYTPTVVRSVKVWTAEAREKDRWDDPDME